MPAALAVMIFAVLSFSAQTGTGDDGIIRVKSAYSIAETVARAVQDGVIRCRLDNVQCRGEVATFSQARACVAGGHPKYMAPTPRR